MISTISLGWLKSDGFVYMVLQAFEKSVIEKEVEDSISVSGQSMVPSTARQSRDYERDSYPMRYTQLFFNSNIVRAVQHEASRTPS
jgi:hypothetical protein